MTKVLVALAAFSFPLVASAESCYGPKLARDAIRAIALVSNKAMITDIVGGAGDEIWANYRYHGYSDHYQVKIDEKQCRVLELKLIAANEAVKEPK